MNLHKVLLIPAVLACLGLAPSAARADWNLVDDEVQLAAFTCVPQTGGMPGFCFTAGCPRDEPLAFLVALYGEAETPAEGSVSLSVDGRPVAAGPMTADEGPPPHWVWQLAPEVYGTVLARLRGGNQAGFALTLGPPGSAQTLHMVSLAGSSRALAPVAEACPAPPPPPVADPVALTQATIRQDCRDMGMPTVTFDDSFASQRDLDGDGTPDLELDYGGATCEGAATLFCGSAGCTREIWRATPAGYVQAFRANYYDVQPGPPGILTFQMHGSFCDRVGAEGCTRRYRWDGNDLVQIE